jgi:hypothetical protein
MAGSVPLQLFEFVFEPQGCYVLDCGAFTPLFGLSFGKHTRRAAALDQVYDDHGVVGLLAVADTTTWLAWERIDRVVVSDRGRFTRPKLAIETRGDAPSWSVRLHDVDTAGLAESLRAVVGESTRLDHVDSTGLF